MGKTIRQYISEMRMKTGKRNYYRRHTKRWMRSLPDVDIPMAIILQKAFREKQWHVPDGLSQDDGDKAESDSIRNQKELIRNFQKSHSEIHIVEEYSDDGYSGVNFERPGFQKMITDIHEKKIDCIIVKDLSRFGRNYIETGKYIEQIFPALGVRFIAINDNYDSAEKRQPGDQIILPFKNLVNDAYSRDLSVKIRSNLKCQTSNWRLCRSICTVWI